MGRAEFMIEKDPIGKPRHRVNRRTLTLYYPEEGKLYEEYVRSCFRSAYPDFVPYEKDIPLRVITRAYFRIPKSTPKRKREDMLQGIIKPTKKPDDDNIEKIVWDALNGVAWYDDAQITSNGCSKQYAEIPRVEVIITEDK